ncbi:MAG: hypothetical protein HYZ16_10490, partial [Bacteroidetes bacterium]|nr:hypothetical protein [Bacteroidota bacterium]
MKINISTLTLVLFAVLNMGYVHLAIGQTNQWAWVSGSNDTNQTGTYGTQGTAASSNVPGARYDAVTWADASDNLWLFGGNGYAASGSGYLNDLWKWDGTNWTWVSGSNSAGQTGTYGTKGTAAGSNVPGARYSAVSWTDASGNFWLFGGVGYAASGSGNLNDLWKWDGSNWTWVSGSNGSGQYGTYGTKGTAAGSNVPGARQAATSWTDASGNFWLFGGFGYAASGSGRLNDLWKWDGTNWTWVSGSNSAYQYGTYGTKGTAAGSNVPGARYSAVLWTDASGNLWLFGGDGYAASGAGYLNDLWRLDPVISAPEIDVLGNGTSIADGDATPGTADHSDFGSATTASGTVPRTFTIENT